MAQPALADATIRHAVLIERLKSGEVAKFDKFLREIDRNLRERLTRDGITAFQRNRLEAMLAEIDAMLAGVLGRFTRQMELDLREFAGYEAGATAVMLDTAGVAATVPATGLVWAAASTQPLQASKGKLLAGFIKDWTDSERTAVTGAIRLGVAQGQTAAELVRTIRGTKAANYADGLLAVTSRHAEAVVRTAVAHVGMTARHETYTANEDVLAGYQWDATLDHRTCVTCQALDGRVFKFGKGPREPAHVQCRCATIPLLSDEFAFLNEGAMRSSKDGPVDASTTYYGWLKTQSASFQDDALGATRGKLFRDGGLSAQRFAALQLDRRWEPLTLAELRKLEPDAFVRAGIDP